MPTGRPSEYTQEVADAICAELSIGKSLRTVCDADDMPSVKTIFNWFRAYPDFLQQYTRAKEESADAMAEELLYIADNQEIGVTTTVKGDGSVETKEEDMLGHRKLKIESRKWLMAKMKPKRYGDKLDLTTDGEKLNNQATLTDEELQAKINGLINGNTEG